jgi:hypothetical protein
VDAFFFPSTTLDNISSKQIIELRLQDAMVQLKNEYLLAILKDGKAQETERSAVK